MGRDKAIGGLGDTKSCSIHCHIQCSPCPFAGHGSWTGAKGTFTALRGIVWPQDCFAEEGGFLPPMPDTAVPGNTPIMKDRAES